MHESARWLSCQRLLLGKSLSLFLPAMSFVHPSFHLFIPFMSSYYISSLHSMSPTMAPSTAAPSVSPTSYPSLSPHSISVISTIAGTGTGSYSGDNGQATLAAINGPSGIAIDTSGNVYFSEYNNQRVRKITASTGIITTYAGTGASSYSGDGGAASSAALSSPNGLCIDSSGNAACDTFISINPPSYLRYSPLRQSLHCRLWQSPHP